MLLISLGLALAILTDTAAAQSPAPPLDPPVETVKRAYGPPAPAKAKRKPVHGAAVTGDKSCSDARQRIDDKTTILVCGKSGDQYRVDPDLRQAEEQRRLARLRAPRRPSNAMPDTGICERSGGCRAAEALDWKAVAIVAATLAMRAARGESVKDILVTNPNPSEYEYYRAAKQRREANELDAAASAAAARAREAKAAKAAAATEPTPSPPPEQ